MYDAGLAILESFDAEIYDNVFSNVKYGIRISLGGGNNHVHDNTFDTCSSCKRRRKQLTMLPLSLPLSLSNSTRSHRIRVGQLRPVLLMQKEKILMYFADAPTEIRKV